MRLQKELLEVGKLDDSCLMVLPEVSPGR